MIKSIIISFFFALTLSGCATFYNITYEFNQDVMSGNYALAEQLLEKNKKFKQPKNVLLYYMNKGYILRQQNKFTESNVYFNNADLYIEDQTRSVGKEALAMITNDGVKAYKADGFESLMIHYYKALNYMALNNTEGALVEVKRMDLMIEQLSSEEKKVTRKLPEEYGFIQNLMGVVYEASGDYNNAFISYRNSYNNYKESEVKVPNQLKKDLLHAAAATGFNGDLRMYEKEFGFNHDPTLYSSQQALVFWENGMGPVKEEWSLNFAISGTSGSGSVYFVNDDLGFSIPFVVGASQQQQLLGLGLTRVAVPKIVERRNKFTNGSLELDGKSYPLELVQDVNHLAKETHKAELLKVLSKTLLRVALKKVAEQTLANENQALGALAMVGNAITEKADTRNWQTLPAEIKYARVPINTASEHITLSVNDGSTVQKDIKLPINKVTTKKMQLIYFHTTDSWGI